MFWGAFLPIFGLSGSPSQSEMGGLVVLYTEKGVDIIETLHKGFYYGRKGYYPLRALTKGNGVFWGAFLPVFGL